MERSVLSTLMALHVIYVPARGGIKMRLLFDPQWTTSRSWSVSIVSVVLSGLFEYDARRKLAESRALVPLAPARRHRLVFPLAFTGRLRSAGHLLIRLRRKWVRGPSFADN